MNRSWYWWALFGAFATAIALLASADAWAAYDPEDLVCETTTDTGTSRTSISLSGTACSNYLTFAGGGVATGSLVSVTIESGDGKLETGYATFTDATPDTLTSYTVLSSSDGVATALSLTGTSNIYLNWNTYSFDGGVYPVSFANVEVEGSTVPVNGMYLPSANVLGWGINSTAELALSATALYPATTGGNALGSTTNMWAGLFLADAVAINWNNGEDTLTPNSSGFIVFDSTSATPSIAVDGSTNGAQIGMNEADANGSDGVYFAASSSLSTSRVCTLTSDTQMIPASCVNRTGEFFWWPAADQTCPTGYSLPTDGSSISQSTYEELFDELYIAQTGTTTSASATVTGLSDTSVLRAGWYVTEDNQGTTVSSGTTISSIDSGTQITLSANATASGSKNLKFGPYATTTTNFSVPDLDTENRFVRNADGTTLDVGGTQQWAMEDHNHTHDNNANRAAGGGQYTTSGGGSWSSGPVKSGANASTETRPSNIAFRGCIAY